MMTYLEMKKSLSLIQNPLDKLDMVIELGKNLAEIPDSAECTEIFGCASFVKICQDGNRFYGVADSLMVRGIIAIILAMVDGKTPNQIKNLDIMKEFQSLNLNFGAARLNGIQSIISFFNNL